MPVAALPEAKSPKIAVNVKIIFFIDTSKIFLSTNLRGGFGEIGSKRFRILEFGLRIGARR